MKKLILIIIAFAGLGFVFSCQKETKDPVLDLSQTVAPSISSPDAGETFILLEVDADSIMTTFNWSATKYNLNNLESVKYVLQMDIVDSNFMNFVTVVNTTETSYSITVGDMNSLLLAMGLTAGESSNMEFRLYSYINNTVDVTDVYSEVLSLALTPYASFVEYPKLWVPGDYQGWDPASAPNIYSFTNDNIFTGYIYMPEGGTYEFKFTSDPDWAHTNYGFGGEGLLDTDPGASNLSVPGPGGYNVTVDIEGLTWEYTLENWGVIGEWLGWTDDIDMIWDAENQYLYLTTDIPDVADNCFKFRANDAWDVNLGAIDPPDGETLTQGGVNIPITEPGNYTFILRFTTSEPTYELIKN
jgi:hypothetical protein